MVQNVRLAVIGGTGVYDPKMLANTREEIIPTPYGDAKVVVGDLNGEPVIFMQRHGAGHKVPPHKINYRANIWALKKAGVQQVLATTAVGSINRNFAPGHFVLPDQFLDYTFGRAHTFFEGGELGVVHTDFTEPYCGHLRSIIKAQADRLGLTCHNGGVYVCTNGPRFETPAEIRAYERLGGDLVGMTSVPECTLAKEAGLCYATISMVTNFAAGISPTHLTHEEVLEIMAENSQHVKDLIGAALAAIPAERPCRCAQNNAPLGA
jgi:5'-methylthioadenosine phosphorylase